MIKHPGARTRALYRWETDDLMHRGGVKQMKSPMACLELANDLLPKGSLLPGIVIRDMKQLAFWQGNVIVLSKTDHYNLTMVHELAHHVVTKGFKDVHSPSFVRMYVSMMHKYFGWDYDDLYNEAKKRKLL